VDIEFEKLINLQKLDKEITDVSLFLENIPSKIEEINKKIETSSQIVTLAKEKMTQNQKKRRDLEAEVKDIKEQISKYNRQLNEVKTNREYSILLKEIEEAKQKDNDMEEEIISEMLSADESEATQKARLKPGMRGFLDLLRQKGIKIALVTNNSQRSVSFLLEKFNLEFDCIISRESGLWKPSGAPFQAVLEKLGLEKEECCVVGDSHFDIKAAEETGIPNVFILNEDKEKFASMNAEVFSSVEELMKRIERLLEKGEIGGTLFRK